MSNDRAADAGAGPGGSAGPPPELALAGHALAAHPLTAERLAKVEAIRAAGGEPYPPTFTPSTTATDLAATHGDLGPGEETGVNATMAGRLMGRRDIGKLVFGVLQDRTGRVQLFADAKVLGDRFEEFGGLDLGDWIGVTGEVITTRRGELSVRVEDFMLLAKALRPLPEKWHGLQDVETRHRRRYLDLLANEDARATMVARSRMVRTLRHAFEERGFIEVETPMLQTIPGGALARPFVTHHNVLGMDMYLRIAPELYLKRLIVGGMDRVFELNRSFRNEGVSPRHNPEFTMLEAYAAYADYFDVMTLLESIISDTASQVTGSTVVGFEGQELDFRPPWPRTTVLGSVAAVTGVEFGYDMTLEEARRRAGDLDIDVRPEWGIGRIVSEVFEVHVEKTIWHPTIVMDYPKETSPLARTHRTDPNLTERFEVIAAGRELANAFSELNDPLEQRRRFEEQALARAAGDEEAHPIDEDYILALEYGMPPTGGLGIGVDRLAMFLTDQSSIREVILFPHLRPEQ